ncbi:glycosyltransferase family 2 protein [candidate division KSB1 bacterium]|nr:glycosyltransferase family 2 protein [candidate division KSB1 bacterium]
MQATTGSPLRVGFSIPTYRNADALAACLTSISRHEQLEPGAIVVVDDSGTGEVANALRAAFPHVTWKCHDRNMGFAAAANHAVTANPCELVVLLNDDTELRGPVSPALREWFARPDLFAVTFQSVQRDGRFREGAKRLVWRWGIPRILHNPRDQRSAVNGVSPSDYAVGGHCALHKARFVALAGFDAMYFPFYWEDVDLCVRASARGWPTVYDPGCVVVHDGVSAIRSNFEVARIREIVSRNRILFARRHARGVQRILLPLGLLVQRGKSELVARKT